MWEEEAAHLRDVLYGLSDYEVTADIGAQIEARAHEIAEESAQLIRRGIPDYSLIMTDGELSETWHHGRQHALQIASMLKSESLGDLEFVRQLGRRRAEQRFPLRHVLHTYRIGHRVTWAFVQRCLEESDTQQEELLRVSMLLFRFTIQYTDLISVIAAGAYSERRRELGNVTEQRMRAFFESLVHGLPLDPEVLSLARAGGLESGPLHLMLIRYDGTREIADRDAALAELKTRFGSAPETLLICELDDDVLCLFPGSGGPEADVREALRARGLDEFAQRQRIRMGVSQPMTRAAQGRAAYREALYAAALAHDGKRIVCIANVPLSDLAIERGDLDIRRLLPAWLPRWRELPDAARSDLEKTLTAFADSNLHVRAAAEIIGVHPNTIGFRLTKIEDITGLSPRRYHDLTEIRTALRLAEAVQRKTAA